jgi:hypothetical protein
MDFVPGFPFSLLCLSFFVILVLVLIVVVLHGWGPLTWFPIVVVVDRQHAILSSCGQMWTWRCGRRRDDRPGSERVAVIVVNSRIH